MIAIGKNKNYEKSNKKTDGNSLITLISKTGEVLASAITNNVKPTAIENPTT